MSTFWWGVGIENTSMPDMGVNELLMTDHQNHWREDLQKAKDLGVQFIRHGLPWDMQHPEKDRYDWSWTDQVISEMQALGLTPIWDLIHFGTPAWLENGFLNPDYPAELARYARDFAARYPQITLFTPFNEPYICAFFRGGNGTWPPYGTSARTFVDLLVPIIESIRQTVQSIQQVNPSAQFWLNDGADGFRALDAGVQSLADELTQYRFIALDVLLGKANVDSWTAKFLLQNGVSQNWLDSFLEAPVQIDMIGLDYYPGSEHVIFTPRGPKPASDWGRRTDYRLDADSTPPGLGETLRLYHQRYQKPVYVAETSSDRDQQEWLNYSTSEVARVRAEGIEVVAYTWWPFFDHIDWNTGLTELTGHVCPSGLYHLHNMQRRPGPVQEAFKSLIQHPPADTGHRTFPFCPGVTS
ncbi:family 1 glycosylhydrolase [Deinococcus roseus]|uniref:Glycoside hydrolase family 1 n=1 Tax=Deinococcus roseus TaxID=392414 RepID=A0ABQ2CYG7_9DEIO|nr:family 1 glycosylhydrolase [Deinococcus roseus]GGJ33220.1 glycoside hydrolase family 1 [Deinococcus roseus]